jgi:hypothetical protein
MLSLFPDVELETFLFLISGCWLGIFFIYSFIQMLGWLFWIGCCFGGFVFLLFGHWVFNFFPDVELETFLFLFLGVGLEVLLFLFSGVGFGGFTIPFFRCWFWRFFYSFLGVLGGIYINYGFSHKRIL